MNLLEKEILEKFQQLEPEARNRLLDLLKSIETERPLSAVELMRLPPEERRRRVEASIASALGEGFETFEAYSEEAIDE